LASSMALLAILTNLPPSEWLIVVIVVEVVCLVDGVPLGVLILHVVLDVSGEVIERILKNNGRKVWAKEC